MKRGLITVLFLIGAVALYVMGQVYAATGLFIVGGCLELVFWIRLFGGFRRAPEADV